MNAITPFDFEGHAVRVVTDEQDTPWFVGRDVCDVLGITNHRDAISRLEDDERESVLVDTLGGKQQMACVNEPGFYRLCFKSRKEAARRFTRWVTHDVLPTLRRTGEYRIGASGGARVPGPSHQADMLVGAARGFSALMRCGRAMGLSRARAVQAANHATHHATGVDLINTLGVAEDIPAPAIESGAGQADTIEAVGRFHQALRSGALNMPYTPCLSADAHALYKHWCTHNDEPALTMPRFIHALCTDYGIPRSAKRYRAHHKMIGPARFLLWGYDCPDKQTETHYLGQCVLDFQKSLDEHLKRPGTPEADGHNGRRLGGKQEPNA